MAAGERNPIRWRLHLAAPPRAVFDLLATDRGRASFWAESAVERDGAIDFVFPGGETWRGEILDLDPDRMLRLRYFGDTTTTFVLDADGDGGTDLLLTDEGVAPDDDAEVNAGWVSVLMNLKAVADHAVDLRNHRRDRAWSHGYADN